MSYRTVELAWNPRTTTEWATFGASRKEAKRQVTAAYPQALRYVGEPFNAASQRAQRTQAQTIAQTCARWLIQQRAH